MQPTNDDDDYDNNNNNNKVEHGQTGWNSEPRLSFSGTKPSGKAEKKRPPHPHGIFPGSNTLTFISISGYT